jgi:hypothetical protein
MNTEIRSWRVVVRTKRRRVDQQERAVRSARAELAAREADTAAAQQEQARRSSVLEAARKIVAGMISGSAAFDPAVMLVRRYQVSDRESELRQAEQQTREALAEEEAAQAALARACTSLRRLERQRDASIDHLNRVVAAELNAQEDRQDEEAEETAASRLLTAHRVQAESAHGKRI